MCENHLYSTYDDLSVRSKQCSQIASSIKYLYASIACNDAAGRLLPFRARARTIIGHNSSIIRSSRRESRRVR